MQNEAQESVLKQIINLCNQAMGEKMKAQKPPERDDKEDGGDEGGDPAPKTSAFGGGDKSRLLALKDEIGENEEE